MQPTSMAWNIGVWGWADKQLEEGWQEFKDSDFNLRPPIKQVTAPTLIGTRCHGHLKS
jgi:hypothetical protein